jgi:hypothetical protein
MRKLLGVAPSAANDAARFGDIPTAGNPSASIGLTAINGVSANWMHADAAPALSQAIAPTWTGLHTFSGSQAGPFAIGTLFNPAFVANASSRADAVLSVPSTGAAAAYTIPQMEAFEAQFGTKGSGSTITNLMGFRADATLGGVATNGYGFRSDLAAASGQWNFYAGGTAPNFLQGTTTIGPPGSSAEGLHVVGNGTNQVATFDAAAGNQTIIVNSNGATGPYIAFNRSGTTFGYVGNSGVLGGTLDNLALRGVTGIDLLTNNGAHVAASIVAAGNVTVFAPSSGVAFAIAGIAGALFAAQALQVASPNTASNSNGIRVLAGTNSADSQLVLTNAANSINHWIFYGDGGLVSDGASGGHGTLRLSGGSGGALGIDAASTQTYMQYSQSGTILAYTGVALAAASLVNDAAAGDLVLRVQSGGIRVSANGGSSTTLLVTSGGASVSGTLVATGTINSSTSLTVGNTTAGSGLTLFGNFSNNVDADFNIVVSQVGAAAKLAKLGPSVNIPLQFQTANTVRMTLGAGLFMTGATGGDPGAGVINATGLLVNGVAIGATTGTFTGTIVGITSATAPCSWTKVGNSVTLFVGVATSTAGTGTTFSINNLPAAIQPATAKFAASPNLGQNNGTALVQMAAFVTGASLQFLATGSLSGWVSGSARSVGNATGGATFTWDLT